LKLQVGVLSIKHLRYHIASETRHYAVTKFDGSAIGLYIDRVPVATQSTSASPDSGGEEPRRMGADSQSLSLMQAIAVT